jgi:hypothetical protein
VIVREQEIESVKVREKTQSAERERLKEMKDGDIDKEERERDNRGGYCPPTGAGELNKIRLDQLARSVSV